MNSYRIKYRYNPTGLIKVFTVDAKSEEDAKAIIVSDWDGVVMECVQLDNTDKEIWLRQRKELIERIDRMASDYDKLQDRCIGYQEARNKLKTENMTIIAKGTKAISECQQDYDIAVKEMYKHADKIEDLESALNTSRYFIYLSGMCGFLLGLACLYFVV